LHTNCESVHKKTTFPSIFRLDADFGNPKLLRRNYDFLIFCGVSIRTADKGAGGWSSTYIFRKGANSWRFSANVFIDSL